MFYGWYIVAALVFIAAYVQGIIGFGFTAVIDPIVEEMGWRYGQISLAVSIRGVEVGLLAPVVGVLLDRIGPRKLLFVGVVLISLGMLLIGHVNSLVTFFGVFIIMASGTSTSSGVLPMTVVGNWFKKKISMATGIVVCGAACGGLFVPIVTWLVDVFNWRTAMTIMGWSSLILLLPISMIIRHKPEQYGLLPDGDQGEDQISTAGSIHVENDAIDFSVSRALKSRLFWHISIAFMCHIFAISAVITHVMPYLNSMAIDRTMQSLVAMVLPLSSIIGRLSFGWLGDYVDKKNLALIGFILSIIVMFSFGYIAALGTWLLIPFLILFGFAYGGPVPIMPALFRDNFGTGRLGSILGFAQGIMVIGLVLGSPVAGFIFDYTGSYKLAWLLFGVIISFGLIILWTAPTRKY